MNTHTDQPSPDHTNQLSEGDSAAIVQDVSSLIFESALGRLSLELEEQQLAQLEQLLETHKHSESLVTEIVAQYPVFQQYADEAALALQEKAETLNS